MIDSLSLHRWPAEWERQEATWIAWPHNTATWPSRFSEIPAVFERFVLEVSRLQMVRLLVRPGQEETLPQSLRYSQNIRPVIIPNNDCWIRDYGPTFVVRRSDGGLIGVNWQYNAWGGKYPPYDLDAAAANRICASIGCAFSNSPMYCEGGALEGNGAGLMLTTSSCLLSPGRNPGWTREMINDQLTSQLGVERVVWVDGGGIEGDDTDGHIDQLARFVNEKTVVAAVSSNSSDSNAFGLKENVRLLREVTLSDGTALTVHELPSPPPRYIDNSRVPESYCNFLFINGAVILPTFRHEATDQYAIDLLTRLLPDRRIIPLDAHDLIWGLGAFHCASQHQPASTPNPRFG